MNKIFNMLCLGSIGIIYGCSLIIIYIISLIALLCNEIVGTKKFIRKFKELNSIIKEEFMDIIETFKKLFEIA